MNTRNLLAVSAACLALLTSALHAQVPQLINYQGRVAVGTVNFDGSGAFKFALVNAAGTTTFWSNNGTSTAGSQPTAAVTLAVTKGLYSVLLGDTALANMTAIPNSVFANADVRLRVWFNDGTNGSQLLTPDQRIAAVGYALMAAGLPNVTASGGNIGIGAVNPVTKLEIGGGSPAFPATSGTAQSSGHVARFRPGDNAILDMGGYSSFGFWLQSADRRFLETTYPLLLNPNGGNVGIGVGTTAPTATLDVAGTVKATDFVGNGSGLTNIPAAAVATAPPGMVLIPAGAFTMGDNLDGDSDAIPISVTVSAFYMDVNEVSLSQWQSVYYWATSNGYTFAAGAGKGPNHPVQTVSWYDVVKWCNARSEQAGKTPVYYTNDAQTTIYKTGEVDVTNAQVKWSANGYRLPTEAEWEKAARGGLSGQRFPWGNTITQNLANYYGFTDGFAYDLGPNGYNAIGSVGTTSPATSPGGTFAANGYGLNDMAGNVFEWCWDRYETPYAGGTDPRGADASGSNRVRRGGSWVSNADYCRAAYRGNDDPPGTDYYIGFRLARSSVP